MRKGFLIFVLFILAFTNFSVAVGVYDSIPIQIQALTDAGAVSAGTYTFKIDISSSSTCSPVLYTNTTTLTTDARGIVSYNLLDVNLNFDEQYWFCYYRDGVLKSTVKAARVPYAFTAKNVTLSGVNPDTNFNLGSYNITASHFIGDGSQLTGVALSGSGDSLWTNVSNVATYSGNVNITGNLTLGGEVTGQNVSRVRVMLDKAQTISNNVVTILQYNNESFDSLNEWDNTTNYRFTATQAGYYLVDAHLLFTSVAWTAGQTFHLALYKNGVQYSYIYYHNLEGSLTTYVGGQGKDVVYLNVGDYIDVRVLQARGSNTDTYYSAGDRGYSYLEIVQLKQEIDIGGGSSSSNYINSIVASGNNSNGSYIKFIDGTMITEYTYTASHAMTTGYGSGYYAAIGPINYTPVPFVSTPYVTAVVTANGGGIPYVSISTVNTTSLSYYAFHPTSNTLTLGVTFHAIGKWSNTPYNTSTITVGGGIPSGAIVAFNRTSCPVGWTLADGSSGTPDLRGIFIRGSGTNSILKYANGSYFSSTLGSYVNDMFQDHLHWIYGDAGSTTSTSVNRFVGGATSRVSANPYEAGYYYNATAGTSRYGNETSPAYYSTIYCVKTTEDTATSNTIWATSGNNVLLNNNSMNVNITSNLTANNFNKEQLYTPTFTGFGTVTVQTFSYVRVGNHIKITGKFTSGTTTGTEARISLPSGLTSDATFIPAIRMVGNTARGSGGTVGRAYYALIESGASYITIGIGENADSKLLGNSIMNAGETLAIQAEIPITGWN